MYNNSIDGYGEDEKITIPAIKRVEIYDLLDANTIVCIANNDTISDDAISPELLAVEKCPTDTTIQDIFKVTRIRTLTMLGNGLEFGSRNTIWLAKNLGVVKDKLELRWSAGFWNVDNTGEANQTWKEYSRLELNKLEYQNIDLMRRIMNPIQKVSFDNFEKMESFNNDPYKNNHIFGLHRIHLSKD